MPIPASPSSTSTTTCAQWIEEVREHLDGARGDEANTLAAAYTAGGTSLAFTYELGNIAPGAVLSVGLSTFRVVSVNTAAKTAAVIPGYQGSTDADQAAGALVRVNPPFTDHRILRAINRHLGALSSPSVGLYRVLSENVAFTPAVQGYEMSDDELLRVLEVRRESYGPEVGWPRVRASEWDLLRAADTTDFPSGVAIRLREGNSGRDVQVVYAAPYDYLDSLTALVSTTGISREAEDIPPLGAAIRLMSGREVSRNRTGSQGDTRRANEVPPGAVAASYRGLVALWAQRVQEEAARLRSQFPVGK